LCHGSTSLKVPQSKEQREEIDKKWSGTKRAFG